MKYLINLAMVAVLLSFLFSSVAVAQKQISASDYSIKGGTAKVKKGKYLIASNFHRIYLPDFIKEVIYDSCYLVIPCKEGGFSLDQVIQLVRVKRRNPGIRISNCTIVNPLKKEL